MATSRWKLDRHKLSRCSDSTVRIGKKLGLEKVTVSAPPNANYRDWQRFTVGGRKLPEQRHYPWDDEPVVLLDYSGYDNKY